MVLLIVFTTVAILALGLGVLLGARTMHRAGTDPLAAGTLGQLIESIDPERTASVPQGQVSAIQ